VVARKVLRAALFFLGDTAIGAVIITCIWALELLFRALSMESGVFGSGGI
jgi:hypothetical protein